MNIITRNPIFQNGNVIGNQNYEGLDLDFSNFDTSNKDEITRFQNWLVSTGKIPVGIKLTSGVMDVFTTKSYKKYGVEYDATLGKKGLETKKEKRKAAIAKGLEAGLSILEITKEFQKKGLPEPTSEEVAQATKDSKKGMSVTTKVLIGVGGLLLIATIIALVTREK